MKRVRFSKITRQKIFEKSHGVCYYCGRPLAHNWTIDHKRPLSKGGSNKTPNLVGCCIKCNKLKADMTVNQFRQFILHHKDPAIKTLYLGAGWLQEPRKKQKRYSWWQKLKNWLYKRFKRKGE